MGSRFNFYDIYGYILPGFAFMVLLWVPLGLSGYDWRDIDFSAGLMAATVGVAYLVGHLLQGILEDVLPPTTSDRKGNRRHPSAWLLDDPDDYPVRNFADHIHDTFQIDIQTDDEKTDSRRRNAFFLCRAVLVQKNVASYVEQMQGMYALMGGMTLVACLAAAYHVGLAVAALRLRFPSYIMGLMVSLGLVRAIWISFKTRHSRKELKRAEKWILMAGILVSLWAAGVWLGRVHYWCGDPPYWCGGRLPQEAVLILLLILGLADMLVAARCYRYYMHYADQFARTVYRDFAALMLGG
jgi:hypothetical protein